MTQVRVKTLTGSPASLGSPLPRIHKLGFAGSENSISKIFFIFIMCGTLESVHCQEIIKPSLAIQHIGENAQVCGTVASVNTYQFLDKKLAILDLDIAEPNHVFTAEVWDWKLGWFGLGYPKSSMGEMLCVTGKIFEYDGRARIRVTEKDQIEVDPRDTQEWDY